MEVLSRSFLSKAVQSLNQSCPPSWSLGRSLISSTGASHPVIRASSPPVSCVLDLVTRLPPGSWEHRTFYIPHLNWGFILILSSKYVLMKLNSGAANPIPFQCGDSSPNSTPHWTGIHVTCSWKSLWCPPVSVVLLLWFPIEPCPVYLACSLFF